MNIVIKDYKEFENYLRQSIIYKFTSVERITKNDFEKFVKCFLKEAFGETWYKYKLNINEVDRTIKLDITYFWNKDVRSCSISINI